MFINKPSQFTPPTGQEPPFWSKPSAKYFAIGAVVLAVIILIIIGIAIAQSGKNKIIIQKPNDDKIGSLPNDKIGLNGSGDKDANKLNVEAESLFFGDFYKHIADNYTAKEADVKLPLNVKLDAANYYPFTREIDLDKVVDKLNQNGFAVIDNPFADSTDNFFAMYDELNKRNLAFLVTGDFLYYYYQNYLKHIYKTVEAEVFYQEFWDMNMEMYKQADSRYRDRFAKVGISNDPILEGLRLEAVYFAMNLELMRPKPGQILNKSKESVNVKDLYSGVFSNLEAEQYSFTYPDYLDPTINKELEIMKKAGNYRDPIKSPALLYKRDYNVFKVPAEYQGNAKLTNFYLARAWSQAEFPLYYRDEACPDCLLDKEDWLINQTAAHLIARDLAANQNWKNKWARIYKTLAYFNNLRSELTYLDYSRSFSELYPNKSIEDIFDNINENREKDLVVLRDKIAAIDFDPAKGSYNRQTVDGKTLSGMRVVQESYEPERFVYDQLMFDAVGQFVGYKMNTKYDGLNTLCVGNQHFTYRCTGVPLDVLNLVFDEQINTSYYKINTNYQSYTNQAPALRNHFSDFKERDWHENDYWSTLDVSRRFLNSRKQDSFPYTTTSDWQGQALNSCLGGLLNSELPLDKWYPAIKKDVQSSLATNNVIKYHFIEPNLALISELQANAKMLFDSFVKLGLVKENDTDFNDLMNDLTSLHSMVLKEVKGEDFSYNDWIFINDLVGRFYIKEKGAKDRRVAFQNKIEKNRQNTMQQSIDGVKLLVEVHRQQGRTVITVGPIFNYWEVRK